MRIASFNVENLDFEQSVGNSEFQERLVVLRQMLGRIDAEVLCLQEVHGQTQPDQGRGLLALEELLEGTQYQHYRMQHSTIASGELRAERNLVVLSKYDFATQQPKQYNAELIDKLQYRKLTAVPAEEEAEEVRWERPILHCQILHPQLGNLHIINLHLKSKLATPIKGQQTQNWYTWDSCAAWGEGFFLSSLKRVGQALETRVLIDQLFDQDELAKIVVCGDFNAEPGEVPVETICGKIENTNNQALAKRALVSCSEGIAQSIRFSHYHHGQGNLLDHMLISQALLPHFDGAEILNETLHDESLAYRTDAKYPASDHAPFVLRLRD